MARLSGRDSRGILRGSRAVTQAQGGGAEVDVFKRQAAKKGQSIARFNDLASPAYLFGPLVFHCFPFQPANS